MKSEDKFMLVVWGVSAAIMIFIGAMRIYKAENRSEVTTGWMTIIGAFTPGSLFLGFCALFLGFIFLVVEGPTYIFAKLKSKGKLWKERAS